jgi:inorganic triphosphatase YgiF
MSETSTITPAHERARAALGFNGESAPQNKKSSENSIPSVMKQDLPEPRSLRPVETQAIPDETAPHSHEATSTAFPPDVLPPPAAEIELKLLVDADRLAGFNDAPIIANHARNKGRRKHLKAVYYDTAERTLLHSGLTLRVRQSGARFTQTVKAESNDDPLRRGEWEAAVPSIAPDLALAMPFLPEELRSSLERHELEPVFTTDIHRHQRIVELPSGIVEVALDHGSFTSGDRSMPVNEIELELKSGSRSAIYDLALGLAEHGSVRPSIHSKSARGFDLATDSPPAPRRPRKLRLDPAIALDDALATILRGCFGHLLQSLPAAEDGRDPEGVHQLRVALRRLRAALDLMRSVGPLSKVEALRAEARWIAQNLSDARDWDIFQAGTLPTIAKACSQVAGFDALHEAAEKRRAAAYYRVRNVLAERRVSSFLIVLGGWIEARGWRGDVAPDALGQLAEPAVTFARRMLSNQYAKVLKRGRRLKSLDAEERHRLRLAVKKLRYVAEFLLPLYGQRKSTRRFSRKLAGLQEELGHYNDIAVTASLLAGLGAGSADGGTAAAAIAGWQAHAMMGVEPRLRDTWSEFAKAKVPWRDAEP